MEQLIAAATPARWPTQEDLQMTDDTRRTHAQLMETIANQDTECRRLVADTKSLIANTEAVRERVRRMFTDGNSSAKTSALPAANLGGDSRI